MNYRVIFFTILLLTSVALGCGDGRPTRVPVSGMVLIDGKPLQSGSVTFQPPQGRPAVGEVVNGQFRLTTFERNDGVVTGTHAVSIHSVDQIGRNTYRWHVPKKYLDAATSGISETISRPTDSLQIELTWGDEQGPFIEKTSGD